MSFIVMQKHLINTNINSFYIRTLFLIRKELIINQKKINED